MGFNKNVSKYVTKTRAYAENHFGTNVVAFLHNNNYDISDLDECFERNSEGMLKNMAIHEIAIAVSFYGVTVDNILTVGRGQRLLEVPNAPRAVRPNVHGF